MGGGFSPEQRARLQEMREQHKLTFELLGLVRRLSTLQAEGTAKLSAAQAKKLAATLEDMKGRDKLEQTDCKEYLTAIKKELTAAQLQELADMQSPWQRAGGGGGHGHGGGGGGKGSDAKHEGKGGQGKDSHGDRPRLDPERPFAQGRALERLESLIETLKETAGG